MNFNGYMPTTAELVEQTAGTQRENTKPPPFPAVAFALWTYPVCPEKGRGRIVGGIEAL